MSEFSIAAYSSTGEIQYCLEFVQIRLGGVTTNSLTEEH